MMNRALLWAKAVPETNKAKSSEKILVGGAVDFMVNLVIDDDSAVRAVTPITISASSGFCARGAT